MSRWVPQTRTGWSQRGVGVPDIQMFGDRIEFCVCVKYNCKQMFWVLQNINSCAPKTVKWNHKTQCDWQFWHTVIRPYTRPKSFNKDWRSSTEIKCVFTVLQIVQWCSNYNENEYHASVDCIIPMYSYNVLLFIFSFNTL